MLKPVAILVTILGSISLANANALHRNPDQPSESGNMMTFGSTTIPIGAYEYCQRYQERCEYATEASTLKLTKSNWKKVVSVNFKVNTAVRPMTDLEIFGVKERWEVPTDRGDCEDYVLAKKLELARSGLPLGAMRVTVVYDENDGGHAVLTLVTDRGDFILDNNNNQVLRWQEAELTYLKRQKPGNLLSWESLKPQS